MERQECMLFLLGACTGAIAATLWAPRSGAATRRLLKSKAMEGQAYIGERTNELIDAARHQGGVFRDSVARGAEGLRRSAVAAGKQAYRETVGAVLS
jgi:gas vesicle protein